MISENRLIKLGFTGYYLPVDSNDVRVKDQFQYVNGRVLVERHKTEVSIYILSDLTTDLTYSTKAVGVSNESDLINLCEIINGKEVIFNHTSPSDIDEKLNDINKVVGFLEKKRRDFLGIYIEMEDEDLNKEYGKNRVEKIKNKFPDFDNYLIDEILDDWKEESLFIKEDKEKYFKGEISWKSKYNIFEKFGCFWDYS